MGVSSKSSKSYKCAICGQRTSDTICFYCTVARVDTGCADYCGMDIALRNAGFRLKTIQWRHTGLASQWCSFDFVFDKAYPKEMFKGLSRKFNRHRYGYSHEDICISYVTDISVGAFQNLPPLSRTELIHDAAKKAAKLLNKWVKTAETTGLFAVYRLTGEF